MSHVDEGRLHAWLDGALASADPNAAEAVRRHLAGCADCRARLEEARRWRDEAADILQRAEPASLEGPGFEELVARARARHAAGGPGASESGDAGVGGSRSPAAGQAAGRRLRAWSRWAWAASVVAAVGLGWWARGEVSTVELPSDAAPLAEDARSGGAVRGASARQGADDVSGATAPSADQASPPAAPAGAGTRPDAPSSAGAALPGRGEAQAERGLRDGVAEAEAGKASPEPETEEEVTTAADAAGAIDAARLDSPAPRTLERVTATADSTELPGRAVGADRSLRDAPRQRAEEDRAAGVPLRFADRARAEAAPEAPTVPESQALEALADRLIGTCWTLELGAWRGADAATIGSWPIPPQGFRLLGEGLPATASDRLARPIPPDPSVPPGAWAPVSAETVRVSWSYDALEVSLELSLLAGGELVGGARASSVLGGSLAEAEAEARPAACVAVGDGGASAAPASQLQ